MKNLLFTIFAFGSLLASGMAGPIIDGGLGLEARELKDHSVEHERSVQGREARGSTDYGSHRRYVQTLFKAVQEYTGQMNGSANDYAASTTDDDKKRALLQVNNHARSVELLINKARTSKVDTSKRDDSSGDTCDDLCIFGWINLLVLEIFYTISYVISKIGLEPAIEYLLGVIFALVRTLTYWDVHITGLAFAVAETVHGIFVVIGLSIVGVVNAGGSTGGSA